MDSQFLVGGKKGGLSGASPEASVLSYIRSQPVGFSSTVSRFKAEQAPVVQKHTPGILYIYILYTIYICDYMII